MSSTVWLICEDESDYRIFRGIVDKRKIPVTVKWLKSSGGLNRLAAELDQLIRVAQSRKIERSSSNDCIVVLHDADEQTQPDRRVYKQIEAICKRYSQDVIHMVARDELESWLLADEGISRWLQMKPQNWGGKKRPSDELNNLLKKKGIKNQGRYGMRC